MSVDIIRPAGPIDERLPITLFQTSDDKPIALLTTFAMHVATFGGVDQFGADSPGVVQSELCKSYGPDLISVVAEGTAGDVNHINVHATESPNGLVEPVRIGREMARAIVAAENQLVTEAVPHLRFARRIVSIPLRDVSETEIRRAQQLLLTPGKFLDRVAMWRDLNTAKLRQRDGENLQVEIQAFAIGSSVAIIALPHEIFVEHGIAIRQASPFPITHVVTLSQDMDFYIPTSKAFAEGSYEVTTSSILPGGGEKMVSEAIQLLQHLKQ